MYLSRLQLNTLNRYVWRRFLDQPYKLHQLVMHGFPDGVTRETANVLHRLEVEADNAILLIQSDIEPDWCRIHSDLLLPVSPFDPISNPAVRKVEGINVPNGRILQFRLVANPTRRLSSGKGNKPGPRVALYKETDQLEWLQKKGAVHGFHLLDVQISHAQKQTDKRRDLTLHTVQFDGRLQVTDPDKLLAAVQRGIGPAKAFGCGLLSLAPG
jgi:CRISPR system Cascade subunit CasE